MSFSPRAEQSKILLITFDVEEFNLPRQRSSGINEDTALSIAQKGAERLVGFCRSEGLKATCFVTSMFAKYLPGELNKLVETGCEMASHGLAHHHRYEDFKPAELAKKLLGARMRLEKITGCQVKGHRSPRFSRVSGDILSEAGFLYDSSIHPTWIPGRYNYLREARSPGYQNGLLQIPVSVVPLVRIPVSWLWFRMYSVSAINLLTGLIARSQDIICVYFHNWEFADLSQEVVSIPWPISKGTGDALADRLGRWLKRMRDRGFSTSTVIDYIRGNSSKQGVCNTR